MRQLGNLTFLVIFSILFLINDSSGLKCWRCSSDATNIEFCGATLDLSKLTDQQKKRYYVDCDTKPPNTVANIENVETLIPKCRVSLQHVNGKETYTRLCYWEQENVPSDSCKVQNYNPSYVKTIDCKTCVEDGCNDRLITNSEQKDNISENNNNVVPDSKNSAVLAVLSHTVLFVVLMLSIVIGY
ncbi:uncharacterized protein LOC119075691 [Bradysia coprophila]|uniref:uncharacterized protein LOC119075691 n=1 Tax=Bradysia coprophila TaxID=38358 RepID=UPI00187DA13C|nr:uncharacterized protein LOC119075691 [Bradysia coprophila]